MKLIGIRILQNLVQHTPIAVCIVNVDSGLIEIYNDNFLKLFDISTSSDVAEVELQELLNSKFTADRFLISKVVIQKDSFKGSDVTVILDPNDKKTEILLSPLYAPIRNDHDDVSMVAIWFTESTEHTVDKTSNEVEISEEDPVNNLLGEIPTGTAILSGKELVFELVNATYRTLVPGR
ncbi:hypothetical protein ASG01_15585 [Chryseobacterium sp. Leaf180]|uniref:hypothetical protein n=1 Tax=Chryseobacterium sp. Leaf180 TaxID=1736289 RepID=UPI0006F681DC|nr:hypothetical protein [Chryseobacterium sp. Leaf180]KQR93938.1 hypothetical protein ASG01_15585 [Chryseobacterium sp. Leaf180]